MTLGAWQRVWDPGGPGSTPGAARGIPSRSDTTPFRFCEPARRASPSLRRNRAERTTPSTVTQSDPGRSRARYASKQDELVDQRGKVSGDRIRGSGRGNARERLTIWRRQPQNRGTVGKFELESEKPPEPEGSSGFSLRNVPLPGRACQADVRHASRRREQRAPPERSRRSRRSRFLPSQRACLSPSSRMVPEIPAAARRQPSCDPSLIAASSDERPRAVCQPEGRADLARHEVRQDPEFPLRLPRAPEIGPGGALPSGDHHDLESVRLRTLV